MFAEGSGIIVCFVLHKKRELSKRNFKSIRKINKNGPSQLQEDFLRYAVYTKPALSVDYLDIQLKYVPERGQWRILK